MALIACPKCGQKISSLARFCPKCSDVENRAGKRPPRLVSLGSFGESSRETVSLPVDDATSTVELLLQQVFKPSLDEMIVMEGKSFLIKGIFSTEECFAYLTSKRYVVCDNSGLAILFQVGIDDIIFAEEGRHLFSKKIVVTTASGQLFQVRGQPHDTWFAALRDPKNAVESVKKTRSLLSHADAGIDWFYEGDGINIGPVKEKNIIQLIQNNHTVLPHTKVWNASMSEWKPAEETILTIYFNLNQSRR